MIENNLVKTQNGVGIVAGRVIRQGKTEKIIVSHHSQTDLDKYQLDWRASPLILSAYDSADVKEVK